MYIWVAPSLQLFMYLGCQSVSRRQALFITPPLAEPIRYEFYITTPVIKNLRNRAARVEPPVCLCALLKYLACFLTIIRVHARRDNYHLYVNCSLFCVLVIHSVVAKMHIYWIFVYKQYTNSFSLDNLSTVNCVHICSPLIIIVDVHVFRKYTMPLDYEINHVKMDCINHKWEHLIK